MNSFISEKKNQTQQITIVDQKRFTMTPVKGVSLESPLKITSMVNKPEPHTEKKNYNSKYNILHQQKK